MRRDGFLTGIMTGAAIGALVALAISPDARKPIMRGAGEMGDRMRKMVRRDREEGRGRSVPREMF